MTNRTLSVRLGLSLVAAAALGSTPLAAQLPQASARALGLGNNLTAGARGFAAVANNPAGLAHGGPAFSLALLPISVEAGLDPITLGDLVDYEGQLVPNEVRDTWLDAVGQAGGQSGLAGLGVSGLALNLGRLGFQLSTVAGGQLSLGPDAAELLLYGNAGRTGSPRDFDLEGSTVDAYALSTAAVALGVPVTQRFSLGVTGKYTMGHALVVGRDAGSLLTADPVGVEVDFPVLLPSDSMGIDNGSGFGLDVGAEWRGERWVVGASIQNLVSTFEWTFDQFAFVPGQAIFDQDTSDSDFDERPVDEAPEALLAAAEGLTLEPVVALGASFAPSPILRVQADVRRRSAEGLQLGPEFHAGVGAELVLFPFLPVRAHVATITDGLQVGGGASLVLGPLNVSGALAAQSGALRDATLAMVSVSFGAN